jgi:hypothetical protein
MEIRKFYLENYPTDEMGFEISEGATFAGLLNELYQEGDVYEYIGVSDSLIRERIFEKLAEELQVDYQYVYNLWN